MLYEKYERRVKRQLTLLKLIKKYRILLMTLAVVSFSMVTGYSATKGLIYDVAIPNAFEYGETVQIRSSSLFSDVTYEYRSEGDTEWSKDQPVRAGKYEVRIITKQVFGSNNTKLYSFEIKPKKVDITLKDTLVLYGVDPIVNIDLVEGDQIDSIAFNYANMAQTSTTVTLSSIVIKDALGSDVTSSYELVFAPQTIAFTARLIQIRILDATQIYDGQILTSNDYEIVDGFLLEGHELQIIGSGSQTEVGISDNHIQSWKVMSGELDVSANYRIDEISGELEVTKRDITIETHSAQKTYDSTPLSTIDYTLIGSLVDGHTIKVISFSNISAVGIKDNIFVIVIEDANGLDMTHNYNIEYQYGKLEIFKRTLVIETTGDQKVYDGKALTNTNFTLVSGELVTGHNFNVDKSSEITSVGEIDNEISLSIIDQNQLNVSDNYDIQMSYNTLMISQRNITLETRSTTAVYDGNPLQYGHFDLTQGTLVDGETFFVAGYTTERNVGFYDNELDIQIQTNNGENRTQNYTIEYILGSLEITPKPIAVTTFNQTKVYDGTPLFEHGFSIEGLVLNHIGQVKTDTKLTLVGQTENILTLEIYEDTIDVSFNYQLSYIYGTLVVTKRAITVRPVIQTRIYDGTPLTSHTVESVYPNDLLEGHVLSATNFGSQTDVGTSINEILTLTITKESVDLTENYEITHETNTLTVTKRDITIETGSTTRIYDGEYLSNNNFEIFQGTLVLDHFGLVEIDTQILDVGSIDNTLSIEIYDREGINKSENYEIHYVKGILEILPRPITIRPKDVEKVYDGTPLTSNLVYSVIQSELLNNHTMVAITKGSQTIVGESKNSILDIQIWLDETNVTNNYEITTEIGYLTVTPRQIVIETYNNSKEYDGKYFYQHDYDIIEGDLAPNQTLWMQFDTQIKEVSVVDNILEFAVMDASNDNVTLNYEITYVYGKLEIYKRVITVIGIDKEKDYDGYALTSNEVKIIEGSLADNQKDDITLSGSITYVGTVQNPFDQVLIMEGLIDVTHNYDITTIEGTLKISPRYIKILSHSVEQRVYDGTWLFEHNYTILFGSLADNEYTTVDGPSIKNVDLVENDILLFIYNQENFETTFNYEIEYVYGILEIIPRPITYLTATDSKVYDDTPLFNTTTKVILGSLVKGHTDLVDKFEDITDVGTIDNIITVLIFDELGEDVTTNYDIKYELGTLTIEPRPITIQSKSVDKEYDGLVFSYPEFTIIGEIVFSHTVEVVFSMEATDAGEYVNIIKIKILNKDGVNKTDNYKIEEDFGTLTIHPRKIQIETATNSFVYDGLEHFDESYTIINGSVVLDHILVVVKNTPITNALELLNLLHFIVIDGNQIDQSHNYELIITEGTLTVTPRPIYFESESSSQEFNGEPFFHPVAHLVTGNLVLDHHYYDYNYATITNVGETDNLYEITIYDGMGIDVSDNYEIHKSSGILEVTPRPITVFTKSNTHIYDSTPFSDTELEYTNLIDTHHLEFVTYAEIINVGTILNEIIVVVLDELNHDVTNNYTISYDYGTLEVLKKAITIQPTFETKEYDGTPLTSNTLMSVVLSDLIEGHKLEGITEGSITNVGTTINHLLEVRILQDEVDVTENYDITYLDGTLEITKRYVEVTTASETKVYDGLPLINSNYGISSGSLVLDHIFILEYAPSITNAGSIPNELEISLYSASFEDAYLNYEIIIIPGELTILEREITVKPLDVTKTYDGTALFTNAYELLLGTLVKDHLLTIETNGYHTNAGIYQNEIISHEITYLGEIVTNNYKVTYEVGTLTIHQAVLTLESHSSSKVYDASPLFETGFTIHDTLFLDHYVEIVHYPMITDVGVIVNQLNVLVMDSQGIDQSENYDIRWILGTLEVTKRPITVKPVFVTKEYDGTPLSSMLIMSVIPSDLIDGSILFGITSGSQTNVGSSINSIDNVFILYEMNDVTCNYEIFFETNLLEVTPRPITIKPLDKTKLYDGIVLESNDYELIMGSLVQNQFLIITTDGKQIDVGQSENSIISYLVFDGSMDVSHNYDVTFEKGILRVMPRPITIETYNQSKVYDGTSLVELGHRLIDGELVLDHTTQIQSFSSLTDVGTRSNELTIAIMNTLNEDVSSNYDISYQYGTIEVTPRPITVITLSQTKEYDGTALVELGYQISTDGLISGHTIQVISYSEITNVGNKENKLEVKILSTETDVTGNYSISYVYGRLIITQRQITVESRSSSKIYDGLNLIQTEFDIIKGSLVLDHEIKVIANTILVNVGVVDNYLLYRIITSNNVNVTSNYKITAITGFLRVNPRPITVKPLDVIKVYDGTPLITNEFELTNGTLLANHTLNIATLGQQLNVGISNNDISTYRIIEGSFDVTYNYQVTLETGTLEITPRPITIETFSQTKVYDGDPLFEYGHRIIEGSLVLDHFTRNDSAIGITDVGIIDNILTVTIKNIAFEDFTYNYEITYQYGKLEVTPRPITIKTASSEKMYDATPLFNLNYDLIDGTLLNGHFLVIDDYIEIINVSEIDNIILIKVYSQEYDDVSQNYFITYNYGKLKITPRPITILTGSDSKVYDDTPLYNDEFSLIECTIVTGHFLEVVDYVTIIDVGVINNELDIVIKDEILQYVTGNYAITYIYGTLEITPRWIHFETASDTREYDGTALFNKGFTILSDPQVFGHIISVVEYTQITNIGNVNNELTFMIKDIKGNVKTHNYALQFSYGNLSVTPRNITIKPKDITIEYTGTTVYTDEFEIVSGSLLSGHVLDVTLSTTQQDVGVGTTTIDSATVWFGFMDVTDNYNITLQTGTIEIEKLAFVIQPQDVSKGYDGLPLTSNVVINPTNDLPENHTIEAVTFGSQTEIGYSINTIVSVTIWFEGRDVTDNFDLVINTGLLEVTGIPIEIATSNSKKIYDGTPLTKDGWSLTKGALLPGHTLEVLVIGSITEVGWTFNEILYQILDEFGDVVTNQYVVTENLGKLRILSPFEPIQILSGSDSKDYDGTPLTFDHWELVKGKLEKGHRIEAEVTGEIVNVGVSPNTFTYVILDADGNDVTGQYEVQIAFGKLVIFDPEDNGQNDKDKYDISIKGWEQLDSLGAPLFRVFSPISDSLYLRERSYGDYNKTGFNSPDVYFSPYNLSPLSFTGLAINNALTSYTIEVRAIAGGIAYMSPYYGLDSYPNNINDTYISQRFGAGYTANYVPISDVDYTAFNLENTLYSEQESVYKEFVYNTYLQLPTDTKAAMLRIASLNGLNPTNPNIIEEVKNYIQSAAIYNMEFRPFPANVDFAVYFLEVLREGICQHFAMAATTMYRALGIPARYVVGFAVNTEANEWVDVGVDRAHAWVEVYVDGFGWVPMEVTAGGAGGGSGTGVGAGDPGEGIIPQGGVCPSSEPCDDLELIEVKSGNASKYYDGTPLTNDLVYYNGRLKAGHSIEFTITGSITQVGETRNAFTFKIVDDDGTDVTSQYRTRKVEGLLVVVPNNGLPIIELQVYDVKKVYNASPFTHSDDEFWVVSDNLPFGYRVELDIKGEVSIAGFLETYISRGSVRIYNAQDVDVTSQFNIVTYYGSIEVLKRSITVNGYTIQKDYDGTPLTSDAYYISRGSLVAGHTMTVTMEGSITNVGTADNKVGSVIILDQDGNDVTENYKITKVKGQLIVTD